MQYDTRERPPQQWRQRLIQPSSAVSKYFLKQRWYVKGWLNAIWIASKRRVPKYRPYSNMYSMYESRILESHHATKQTPLVAMHWIHLLRWKEGKRRRKKKIGRRRKLRTWGLERENDFESNGGFLDFQDDRTQKLQTVYIFRTPIHHNHCTVIFVIKALLRIQHRSCND